MSPGRLSNEALQTRPNGRKTLRQSKDTLERLSLSCAWECVFQKEMELLAGSWEVWVSLLTFCLNLIQVESNGWMDGCPFTVFLFLAVTLNRNYRSPFQHKKYECFLKPWSFFMHSACLQRFFSCFLQHSK